MKHSLQQTWATLLQAGAVEGDAPAMDDIDSPWYVKALLAFSGWLASIFLLGFLAAALSGLFQNQAALYIIGSISIAIAYKLLTLHKNDFFEHVALSLSLAGQILIIWAIFDSNDHNTALSWALTGLLQVALVVVMPNFIHRVGSAFAVGVACNLSLNLYYLPFISTGILMLAIAWLWFSQFKYPAYSRAMRAAGYGLMLSLVSLKSKVILDEIFLSWYRSSRTGDVWLQPWMGDMLTSAALLFVVWKILQRHRQVITSVYSIAALTGTLVLCALSLEAQGVAVGVMIMLLGFSVSNRIVQGLGIISLLYYVSYYYYSLNITLLDKAQTLLVLGMVMLGARWLISRYLPRTGETSHV